MNQKLTLPQTILITIVSIILINLASLVPGIGALLILVSSLFVVIGTLCDVKQIITSTIAVILSLIFTTDIINIFGICLNFIIPGIIIGITTKKVLKHGKDYHNKYEPVFIGSIVFIVGILLNYILSKYILNINILDNFVDLIKLSLSTQMDTIKESISSLPSVAVSEINEDFIIKIILNMMPMILFTRSIFLAILTYFLGVFVLKRINKLDIREIKFSNIYLPGNAILISFVLYMILILLGLIKIPLSTDLILFNLELVFYLLFLVQGLAVGIYFIKKWSKEKSFLKIVLGLMLVILFGIPSLSMIGMIDCVFDFRKVRSYESV